MKIGAQLYTVRMFAQNERDLGRTLEKIAGIGYEYIQVSGIGNIAPEKVKNICDQNGLKIVLTHCPEHRFLNDIGGLIKEHQMYGCRYVGLGMMSDRYRTMDMFDEFFYDFEKPLEKLHENGLHFMYHNHALEFSRLPDGRVMMDVMLERFPKELMGVTADTYWMQFAGLDVNDWLTKHADRLPCVHLKDMIPDGFTAKMAAVGSGNMNFEKILDTLRHNGVTEYALVEQDDCYGESPFCCLKSSLDYVNNILGGK
ncbi:MAG: sugar phosphate isomerase/epimerase [Clostridia bacterium]|nr:sugar phosphate isomerase/epimerase [Clostridia bacterium]